MMTMTTTSTTISTAAVSTSRAVSFAKPLALMSGSLNAEHLATISLAEFNDATDLPTWVDHKYLVPLKRAQEFVGSLSSEARVLEIDGRRRFSYASTYFGTPGLETLMLTTRKRCRCFKIRIRTYLDSGLYFLEVGTRDVRGATIKRHMGYHPGDASRLTGSGRAFVAACLASAGVTSPAAARDVTATLWPVLATTYEHTALYLPRTEARATIDAALTWQRLALGGRVKITAVIEAPQVLHPAYLAAATDDGEPVTMAGVTIVEMKNPITSSLADRALQGAGHRPTRILKYTADMTLLHPELPADRQYRTLAHELVNLFGTSRSNLESIGATCANTSIV